MKKYLTFLGLMRFISRKVENFLKQNVCPVLIISYEMLLRGIERLRHESFDLLLCDEGHRLKNGQIKTSSLLASLDVRKRIILTGTPVQNDLQVGTNVFFRIFIQSLVRAKSGTVWVGKRKKMP